MGQGSIPAKSGGAPGQALLQAIAGKGDAAFNGLAVDNLFRCGTTRAGLSLRGHPVLEPELQRVYSQSLGNPFHQRFQGKVALGRAQGAVGTGGRAVGIGQVGLIAHVGTVVKVDDALTGAAGHPWPRGGISSGVEGGGSLNGGDGSILPGSYLELNSSGVASAPGDELILPGVLNAHRLCGLPG